MVSALDAEPPRDRAKRLEAAPFPQPQQPLVPVPPRVTVALGTPRGPGVDAATAARAFASSSPDFLACESLARPEDDGAYDLPITFASGGNPLLVRPPSASSPSPYVRCVMERACGLRGEVAAGEVTVPVRVTWAFPRAKAKRPADAGMDPPVTFFEDVPEAARNHAFFRHLRTVARAAARTCTQPLGEGAAARLTISLSAARTPTITGVAPVALGPAVLEPVLTCIAARLKAERPTLRPEGFDARTVAVIVDWTP